MFEDEERDAMIADLLVDVTQVVSSESYDLFVTQLEETCTLVVDTKHEIVDTIDCLTGLDYFEDVYHVSMMKTVALIVYLRRWCDVKIRPPLSVSCLQEVHEMDKELTSRDCCLGLQRKMMIKKKQNEESLLHCLALMRIL